MKPKRITEEPWKSIIAEEWRRCSSRLIGIRGRVPSFYWGRAHGSYAHCSDVRREIVMNPNYMKYWAHPEMELEFRRTIRHEVIHLTIHGHGPDFVRLVKLIGGERFVPKHMLWRNVEAYFRHLTDRAGASMLSTDNQ